MTSKANAQKFANALPRWLGWLSIGVGVAELIAPRRIAGAVGVKEQAGLLRGYGLREIAAGLGLLATSRPTPWLWTRVAGDALDLALLAPGLRETNRQRSAAAAATTAVAAIALLDLYAALRARSSAAEQRKALIDYGARSGFPKPAAQMVGAALRG